MSYNDVFGSSSKPENIVVVSNQASMMVQKPYLGRCRVILANTMLTYLNLSHVSADLMT